MQHVLRSIASWSIKAKLLAGFDCLLAIVRNPERQRRMQEIAAQFGDYRKGIDAAFDLRRNLDKLVADTLDPVGTAARADFDTLITNAAQAQDAELTRNAQQAQQSLMLLRLNSGKVIDRQRDDVAAQKVASAQTSLTKLMSMLDAATTGSADRPVFDVLRGHVMGYEAAYREGMRLKAALEEQVNARMKPEAEKLATAAAAVQQSGTAE